MCELFVSAHLLGKPESALDGLGSHKKGDMSLMERKGQLDIHTYRTEPDAWRNSDAPSSAFDAYPEDGTGSAGAVPEEGMVAAHPLRCASIHQTRTRSAFARNWMAQIPPHVQPVVTAQKHPHVIERIAPEWRYPIHMRALFWDLLIDQRGNRWGFSFEVFCELSALQTYYLSLLTREQRGFWEAGKSGT